MHTLNPKDAPPCPQRPRCFSYIRTDGCDVIFVGDTDESKPSLEDFIEANGGHFSACPGHPVTSWQYEVANNYTRKGYWEWAYAAVNGELQA